MKNAKVLFAVCAIACTGSLHWIHTPVFASESSDDIHEREITAPSEIIAVLDLISTCTQDNYRKIQTWTGQAEVEIKYLHTGKNAKEIFQAFTDGKGEPPHALLQIINEQFEFAVNAQKNLVYTDSFRAKPSRYLDAATLQDLGNKGSNPHRLTCIATPDYLIQAEPRSVDPKEKKITASWATKIPSKRNPSTELYDETGDPRLTFAPGGVYPWKGFDSIRDKIQMNAKIEFDGYQYKVYEAKRGDQQIFKIIHPAVINLQRSSPEHYVVTTKICSGKYGYNFTEWKISRGDGLLLSEYFWEYELVKGVFLPALYIEKQYNSSGEIVRERKMQFVVNKINQSLNLDRFDYKNLPLRDGDLFIDEIENKRYTFNAGRLVEEIKK
ncbi:MAG: hypothetical protein WHS88_12540 [Anaerohalosphaeraceae bacterium]